MKSSSKEVSLKYPSSSASSNSQSSSSSQLDHTTCSSDSSDDVCRTLYLLDRFGVSDQFYHELSMANPSLPRSYKVKETCSSINSQVELVTLPLNTGYYTPLKERIADAIAAEVSFDRHCMYIIVQ